MNKFSKNIIALAILYLAHGIRTDLFKRFVKVFSVDFLVRGGNFLLIFVFTALMSQREFGIYGYLYSFAMIMSGILSFGFNVALTKNYSDTISTPTRQKDMLFTSTTSLVLLLTIAMAIIYCTGIDKQFFVLMNQGENINFDYSTYRLYTAIAIISTIFTQYLTFFFVSSEQIKNIQRFNLFRFFLANSAAILIIIISDGDSAMLRLAITYSTEFLLTLIFGKMFLCKGKFDLFFLKKSLKLGLPFTGTAIVYAIINFGDKYFVMKHCGVDIFATYSLSVLVAMILIIVFQSFNFVWLPLFMKEGDLLVQKRKMKHFTFLIIISFFCLAVIIWCGVWAMLHFGLLKAGYSEILLLLPPLLVSQIAAALTQLYANYMTYFEKTHIQFVFGSFISVMALICYYWSVRWFDVMGICWSLMLVNVISFAFYYWRTGYYVSNRLH